MSSFEQYQPIIPSLVQDIQLRAISRMVDELDTDGVATGQKIEKKGVVITAVVTDDNDKIIDTHEARDNDVVTLGLITQAQADALQVVLDDIRATAEARLLPTP